MRDIAGLADVVVMTVKSAMAPVLERLAAAEAKVATAAGLEQTITALRERLVVAETKAALMVVPVLPDGLVDRVASLESKGFEPVDVDVESPTMLEVWRRISVLEQRPIPVPVTDDLNVLRAGLAAIETKAVGLETRLATPDPLGATVEKAERTLADIAKDISTLRERVAVVEVRQSVPGPSGPAGKDGKDGADGLGFDDLIAEQDDDRTFTMKAVRGHHVKAIGTVKFPFPIHKDVWLQDKIYDRGDVVTWDGSWWICHEPATTGRPGESGKAWKLTVKRGQNGRDGKDGKAEPEPLPIVTVGASRV